MNDEFIQTLNLLFRFKLVKLRSLVNLKFSIFTVHVSQNGSATSDYVARIRTRIFNLGGSQKGRHVCFNLDSTKNKDIINVDKTIMNTHD